MDVYKFFRHLTEEQAGAFGGVSYTSSCQAEAKATVEGAIVGGCKAQLERELKSLSGGACTGGWVDGGVLRCSVSVCVCVCMCVLESWGGGRCVEQI